MNRPELIEQELLRALDDTMSMSIGLSSGEDADYDLNYISDKLKLVSVYQERLSDLLLKITKIGLEVTQTSRAKMALAGLKSKQLKASEEYRELPTNEKGHWLANQLLDLEGDAEVWKTLSEVVSEVKKAITERVATVRRLDSDIRLHAKIYEARVAAGATSPSSYTGNQTDEIDIS